MIPNAKALFCLELPNYQFNLDENCKSLTKIKGNIKLTGQDPFSSKFEEYLTDENEAKID